MKLGSNQTTVRIFMEIDICIPSGFACRGCRHGREGETQRKTRDLAQVGWWECKENDGSVHASCHGSAELMATPQQLCFPLHLFDTNPHRFLL